MKTYSLKSSAIALLALVGLVASPITANATPTLQLGITGGSYDPVSETVLATTSSFALYAYLLPSSGNLLSDTYFLSMSVSPQIDSAASLGSFSYNSTTVNVTSDMTYGTPPLDAFSDEKDRGDLAEHGIFPTYFTEVGFQFSRANQSKEFNTAENPTWGPQTGNGMYFQRFDIDTSNLAVGYSIHFDLYNTKLCSVARATCAGTTDTDITQFAPFSHDAQSAANVTPVPEPESYAMLIAGLGLMGFVARRRSRMA